MTTSEIAAASLASDVGRAPLLRIQNVAKNFGKNAVLRNISLEIGQGEFLTILGESGSGKTTLLRIVAGFESASSGEVWMGGERLDLFAAVSAASEYGFSAIRPIPAHDSGAERRLWIARSESA